VLLATTKLRDIGVLWESVQVPIHDPEFAAFASQSNTAAINRIAEGSSSKKADEDSWDLHFG
jgi:hypothetical protein